MSSGQVDPIVGVIWQHVGNYFTARVKFESGFVSGAGPVIEPDLVGLAPGEIYQSGFGVYRAPSLPFALLVGPPVIDVYFRRYSAFPEAKYHKFVIKDSLNRRVVGIKVFGQDESFRITEALEPHLVSESWSETRI